MRTNNLNVRRARSDEHGHLVELWERSVRATHGFLSDQAVVALRPLVAAELANETLDWWVAATEQDIAIGFLAFACDAIEGLFIDPDHAGRGAGTLLVSHAQGLSAGGLTVDVNEANPAAIGFYRSLGFEVVSRTELDADGRPFPTLRMQRALPSSE
jgi:putative acetyltransferase